MSTVWEDPFVLLCAAAALVIVVSGLVMVLVLSLAPIGRRRTSKEVERHLPHGPAKPPFAHHPAAISPHAEHGSNPGEGPPTAAA